MPYAPRCVCSHLFTLRAFGGGPMVGDKRHRNGSSSLVMTRISSGWLAYGMCGAGGIERVVSDVDIAPCAQRAISLAAGRSAMWRDDLAVYQARTIHRGARRRRCGAAGASARLAARSLRFCEHLRAHLAHKCFALQQHARLPFYNIARCTHAPRAALCVLASCDLLLLFGANSKYVWRRCCDGYRSYDMGPRGDNGRCARAARRDKSRFAGTCLRYCGRAANIAPWRHSKTLPIG